ncbi:DUF5071 domain-containing protein [Hymenobacter sp. BT683]|uniref:DUF5071 domain-containing protein n=1 Tax=Hymenobacter jeongseonensis TaxID=2791027 RepID=A0ABS0II87_9BACT|nr:DUF5071 domain-containing protein [Hymenobacter jeongseonensis]MBF9238080.1 DUF5071 domain-containing protein [Hymenobacter jeongseonensis]
MASALTAEQEQAALQRFGPLSDANLAELTSTRYLKSWPAGVALQHLPVARLVPYAEPLLVHLQDLNWCAAPYVAKILVAMGAPAVPALRRVFATDPHDGVWMMNLLYNVVQRWEAPVARLLEADLVGYVRYAAPEGESIAALEALQRLLPAGEHRQLYDFLRGVYGHDGVLLGELRNTFDYE